MTEGAGHAPAPGNDAGAGHGPTVLDMLEHSGVAPLLHMPVGDILAGKGISIPHPPPMPPLPQLPSLPPLDLTALFKPLTDLLAGFGSGNMANAPFDPTQLFSGLQQAFESVIGLGNQAMSAVAPFWAGAGGASAMVKGTEANANNATTATQSGDISRIVATATATVGKGVALLEGVIANFATSLGAIIPFITTPPGIAAAMASASAHLTTGLGIVAQTRAELTAHTANMTVAGAPVAITAAPQVMSAVPGMASSAVQAVASPIQSLVGGGAGGGLAGGRGFASRVEPFRGGQNADLAAKTSGASAGGGGGGGAIPGVAGLGGASAGASAPTSPFSAKPSDAPMSGRTTAAAQASEEVVGRATTTSTVSPGGMPMGAAGAAGATASNSSHSSDRDTSVDARHADDVVGEVPTASPSVLGGVEPSVAESVWDSPDEIES